MTKIISTLLLVLVLMANSMLLAAQEEFQLVPGQRVRVSASKFLQKVNDVRIVRARRIEKTRFVANVVILKPDTLVIKAQGWDDSFFIPLANLQKLELSRGRKSNLGKGAKFGFLIGAGLGFFSGAVAGSGDCLGFDDRADPEGCSVSLGVVSGLALGLLGTGIGAGAGAAQPGDVWEEVDLESLNNGRE